LIAQPRRVRFVQRDESGRLARQLAGDKSIHYVGTDVVPRLLESAQALTGRNDWEFHLVEGSAFRVHRHQRTTQQQVREEIKWENGTVAVLRKV
jgi:hypothetical protein